MKYDGDDHYELSTGTTFYAHTGTLGLSPEPMSPKDIHWYDGGISYGADGGVRVERSADGSFRFSPKELVEIADFMINVWNQYKVTVLENWDMWEESD